VEKNEMKKIWFYLLFVAVLLGGCAEKPVIISEGYDYTSFGSGIRVYTEITQHNLLLHIDNIYGKYFKVWVVHEYKSKIKIGNERQMIYDGHDLTYNINILIPEDKNKENMEHIFIVKILNKKGIILYDSPILKFRVSKKNE
jgi:hypothetical protein